MNIVELSLSLIDLPKFLVRPIDGATVNDLRESIKQVGLLQPIVARKKGVRYEVCFGVHRFLACKGAELKTIPTIITDISKGESIIVSIIENIQRLAMTPYREGELFLKTGYSETRLAEKLGKSRYYVQSRIQIYKNLHPELKTHIGKTITIGNAVALSKYPPAQQLDIYKVMTSKREGLGIQIQEGTGVSYGGGIGVYKESIYCRCPKCESKHLKGVSIEKR